MELDRINSVLARHGRITSLQLSKDDVSGECVVVLGLTRDDDTSRARVECQGVGNVKLNVDGANLFGAYVVLEVWEPNDGWECRLAVRELEQDLIEIRCKRVVVLD
mgnify:CR=1 FL=1